MASSSETSFFTFDSFPSTTPPPPNPTGCVSLLDNDLYLPVVYDNDVFDDLFGLKHHIKQKDDCNDDEDGGEGYGGELLPGFGGGGDETSQLYDERKVPVISHSSDHRTDPFELVSISANSGSTKFDSSYVIDPFDNIIPNFPVISSFMDTIVTNQNFLRSSNPTKAAVSSGQETNDDEPLFGASDYAAQNLFFDIYQEEQNFAPTVSSQLHNLRDFTDDVGNTSCSHQVRENIEVQEETDQETMDFVVKQWAAGKEDNLLSLLSTLEYVLWPECNWQPVSIADLLSEENVKKVYRRATLRIHPDKVQHKGATHEHKYIAERVFHILKEAWNTFSK